MSGEVRSIRGRHAHDYAHAAEVIGGEGARPVGDLLTEAKLPPRRRDVRCSLLRHIARFRPARGSPD